MKTAAVYDRWLYTLGGGEQVAFSYAQMLRDLGYKVSILTHTPIDQKKAEAKLSVDLKNIDIQYLPPLATEEISPYTEKYDVFINTSYLDYFPNRAKLGILSVFFPGKIFLSPLEYFKRAVAVPSLRRLFIYPANFEGFSYAEVAKGKVMTWLGEKSSIIFNQDIDNLMIKLYMPRTAFSTIDSFHFFLNEVEINPTRRRLLHQSNILEVFFQINFPAGSRFSIILDEDTRSERIALVGMTIKSWRFFIYNRFKKLFPIWELRLHGGPGITKRADLETYNKIVTISEFSRKWIDKYWGLDSQILYPTIDVGRFKAAKNKKNWIIHVGRFFVAGHCKKQLDLARAFTKMVSAYGVSDWELHFVGSVHEGESHQAYYDQVRSESEGYPVFFHTDVTSETLHDLLSQAKIYWHATGLDENEATQPILFEHFGITTVEAMASGCVPVVINAGGQKEIVTADSGFLWDTRQELTNMTLKLIEDDSMWKKYSANARNRSLFFDKTEGIKRFGQILTNHNKSK